MTAYLIIDGLGKFKEDIQEKRMLGSDWWGKLAKKQNKEAGRGDDGKSVSHRQGRAQERHQRWTRFLGPIESEIGRQERGPSVVSIIYSTGQTAHHAHAPRNKYSSALIRKGERQDSQRYRSSLKSCSSVHSGNFFGPHSGRAFAGGFSRFLEEQHTSGATTTSTAAPYSSTDIIGSYNNDANRLVERDSRTPVQSLDSVPDKKKQTDLHPSSRRDSRSSLVAINTRDRANTLEQHGKECDRIKDDILPPPHKQNYFKPTGTRNTFLTSSQVLPQRLQPPRSPSRDPEDLVAMGTLWNPSSQVQSASNQHLSKNGRVVPLSSSTSAQQALMYQQPTAPQSCTTQAPVNTSPFRKTVPRTSTQPPHHHPAGMRGSRESEPKYSDPMGSAPPSFQQRIAELSALEADTCRWERARKIKRKSKTDS